MSGSRRNTSRSSFVAAAAHVTANRLALRLGLRPRVDGWRRAAGLVLRGEESTFVLSAFGLRVWSDVGTSQSPSLESTQAHLAQRLDAFLARRTSLHIRVRHTPLEDLAEPSDGASYTLGFEPAVEGPARFTAPTRWLAPSVARADSAPSATSSPAPDDEKVLNIVCRIRDDGLADLWVRVNHVGADGVPVQEMLTTLEAEFGASDVIFPTPEAFAPFSTPRAISGRSGLAEIQMFLDFAPLLTWRKKQNERLPEPMTFAAALLWNLARHPALAGRHMGTTVEMPAIDGLSSGVGVVVVRPATYITDGSGLARYVHDFNRQMEQTRRRTTGRCRTLDAAAHVAPGPAAALLRHGLRQGRNAFGSLGLTVLKDARVFGAPIADTGHDDGFIAIGSLALPTATSQRVGCVIVKGPADRIARHPRIMREVIAACVE